MKKEEIRSNRLWKHWVSWLGTPFGPDLKEIIDYNPEKWRKAFEIFQTRGSKSLSTKERYNITPLISAQKNKEIFLTSLSIESMEYWGKGWGWAIPWVHTLDCSKNKKEKLDRLTYVAILRTMKSLKKDPLDFFMRHPGIPSHLKQKYLHYRINL